MSRTIPKVVLGGITGIVAMDISELCFFALDQCALPEKPKVQLGANVTNDYMDAKRVLKEEKEFEQLQERKRDAWKRGIRVVVMALVAYLVIMSLI